MIRANIEYNAGGLVGLNYVDTETGLYIRKLWLWCDIDDPWQIYDDLARVAEQGDGVLENYQWAISTLVTLERDYRASGRVKKVIPKESSRSMFDRIISIVLGVQPYD